MNISFMLFHHFRNITQSQSIPLSIMRIALRHAEEFFKHFILIIRFNTNTIIRYGQFHIVPFLPKPDCHPQRFLTVLDRIVEQVEDHAQQVQAIDTTGVEATAHVNAQGVERPDEPAPCLDVLYAVANAPDAAPEAGLFRVPRVIG